ncbi:MAG TPA: class I SAM-dependent methyltransferase [Actinomycetes bacterium]|nr:class I SAM-dependent methyltransferase [Actinomycetes bacterium]
MNLFHRWYCGSSRWAAVVDGSLLPWVLDGVELGPRLLEIGPGPGLTTDVLRHRAASLTALELDPALAAKLGRRLGGTGVRVVRGDGAALPFRDGSFDAAVMLTMLHHVPSAGHQDRILADAGRCLRPGGLLVGSDSLPSLRFRLYHLADTMVVVDPDGLPERLRAAGFDEVSVTTRANRVRFRARRPGTSRSDPAVPDRAGQATPASGQ